MGAPLLCTSDYWGGPVCSVPAVEAVVKWDQTEEGPPVYVVAPVCAKHGPRRVSLEVVDQAQDVLEEVWMIQRPRTARERAASNGKRRR
jgi:hypothetical protein